METPNDGMVIRLGHLRRRMGHAGAIISGNTGTAQGKVAALKAANVPVADTIFDIPKLVKEALSGV